MSCLALHAFLVAMPTVKIHLLKQNFWNIVLFLYSPKQDVNIKIKDLNFE
jgi:hypothetical protein